LSSHETWQQAAAIENLTMLMVFFSPTEIFLRYFHLCAEDFIFEVSVQLCRLYFAGG
jgi:hypothetical protein